MHLDTLSALGREFNPPDIYKTIKFKHEFNKAHPDYFKPDGIITFCGPQGSGKTLSAVSYICRLMDDYPMAILLSNVDIKGYENRTIVFNDIKQLKTVRNDEYGVIVFIDEIQLLFNSLESKNMDLNLFTTICQQRKQRVHIVGTSQLFNRISKPFREQFKYAVMCSVVFGVLQYNKIVKGDECTVDDSGKVVTSHARHKMWFHTPNLYDRYDTLATIDRMNFCYSWNE